MRRREFIAALGGTAAIWPLVVSAQQSGMPVIGFLNSTSLREWEPNLAAFHSGLNSVGYVEGRNVAIEYRWADGNYERLPELVADLASRRVSVIVSSGGDITPWTAKAATQTIPLVFIVGNDPARSGLVTSLNRPEGNATGLTMFGALLNSKRLDFLHQVAPQSGVIAALINPKSVRAESDAAEITDAARKLGLRAHILHVGEERDFEAAFVALIAHGAKAVLVGADPMFVTRRDQLVALAAHHAIPTVYPLRSMVQAGGLMS